jgi:hypothetical protein
MKKKRSRIKFIDKKIKKIKTFLDDIIKEKDTMLEIKGIEEDSQNLQEHSGMKTNVNRDKLKSKLLYQIKFDKMIKGLPNLGNTCYM